jgi:Ion channel
MNRPAPETVRRRFFIALGHAIHLAWPVLSTMLAIQIAFGLLIGFVEGWSVGDAVYFTFVTGLTIGYGEAGARARTCDRGWCLRALPQSPGSSSRAS